MKPFPILLIFGCLTVLIVDVLGSIASRRLNFNYSRVAPLSFLIFCIIGFVGTHESNQVTGIILTAAVGFFDSTIGWKTSGLLKANTGKIDNNPSVSRWISTSIFVTLLAAICGLIGSGLSSFTR